MVTSSATAAAHPIAMPTIAPVLKDEDDDDEHGVTDSVTESEFDV